MNGIEKESETMMSEAIEFESDSNINIPHYSPALIVKAEAENQEDTLSVLRSSDDEIASEDAAPAAAGPGQAVSHSQIRPYQKSERGPSETQASVLLLVFTVVISGILTTIVSYRSIFPTKTGYVHMENFVDMQQLPLGFHFLMLTTCAFSVSMSMILLLVWSQLGRGLIGFYLRAVVLFVVAIIVICYAILLRSLTLNFRISMGGEQISGFWLLWLYSICTILIWGTLVLIFKRNLPCYSIGIFSQP